MTSRKIKITAGEIELTASLLDTPTADSIFNALPFSSTTHTWGDEIYFHVPAQASLETNARDEVKIGELAYWPTMPAFCIFFGPTPVSLKNEPRAASPVNVFGQLDEVDLPKLKAIASGEQIHVSKL